MLPLVGPRQGRYHHHGLTHPAHAHLLHCQDIQTRLLTTHVSANMQSCTEPEGTSLSQTLTYKHVYSWRWGRSVHLDADGDGWACGWDLWFGALLEEVDEDDDKHDSSKASNDTANDRADLDVTVWLRQAADAAAMLRVISRRRASCDVAFSHVREAPLDIPAGAMGVFGVLDVSRNAARRLCAAGGLRKVIRPDNCAATGVINFELKLPKPSGVGASVL